MSTPWFRIAEEPSSAPVQELFERRYGTPPPDFPHHVIAWYRRNDGIDKPACYIHFTAEREVLLGGGACVDNRLIREMPTPARQFLRASGGLYHMTLAWAVQHFAPRWPAIFGYCGDPLAERVDLAVGFERTRHPHLLAYWTQHSTHHSRQRLTEQAHAVGPF